MTISASKGAERKKMEREIFILFLNCFYFYSLSTFPSSLSLPLQKRENFIRAAVRIEQNRMNTPNISKRIKTIRCCMLYVSSFM